MRSLTNLKLIISAFWPPLLSILLTLGIVFRASASDRLCVETLERLRGRALSQDVNIIERQSEYGIARSFHLSRQQLDEMSKVISDVNDIVGPALILPSQVNLEIYDQYEHARANSDSNTIYVGYYVGLSARRDKEGYVDGIPGYKKSPRMGRAILAHEYGHILLDANLSEAKKILLEARNNNLLQQPTYGDEKLFEAKVAAQRRLDILYVVRSAYHELFADTVAAIYAQDLRIMTDALGFQSGPLSTSQDSKLRDFELRTSTDLLAEEKEGVHTQMNFARRYIGSKYLNRMMKPTLGRRRFLKILALAINDEIVALASRSDLLEIEDALSFLKIRQDESILIDLNRRLFKESMLSPTGSEITNNE